MITMTRENTIEDYRDMINNDEYIDAVERHTDENGEVDWIGLIEEKERKDDE